jgi:hypothetical protein
MLDAIPACSHERIPEQDQRPHSDRQPNEKRNVHHALLVPMVSTIPALGWHCSMYCRHALAPACNNISSASAAIAIERRSVNIMASVYAEARRDR